MHLFKIGKMTPQCLRWGVYILVYFEQASKQIYKKLSGE
jgi:hypothetical protein